MANTSSVCSRPTSRHLFSTSPEGYLLRCINVKASSTTNPESTTFLGLSFRLNKQALTIPNLLRRLRHQTKAYHLPQTLNNMSYAHSSGHRSTFNRSKTSSQNASRLQASIGPPAAHSPPSIGSSPTPLALDTHRRIQEFGSFWSHSRPILLEMFVTIRVTHTIITWVPSNGPSVRNC